MSENLLRQVASELNNAPGAAARAPRMATLVTDNNRRIAAEAVDSMAFDSSPYAYQLWLAAMDQR